MKPKVYKCLKPRSSEIKEKKPQNSWHMVFLSEEVAGMPRLWLAACCMAPQLRSLAAVTSGALPAPVASSVPPQHQHCLLFQMLCFPTQSLEAQLS